MLLSLTLTVGYDFGQYKTLVYLCLPVELTVCLACYMLNVITDANLSCFTLGLATLTLA